MIEKEYCTGCGACAMVCSMKAIQMKPDKDGFLYPDINQTMCVNCRKCDDACPVSASSPVDTGPDQAWMAYARNEGLRHSSSSGGAFSLIAETVLMQGGTVFGCTMSKDCYSAHHIAVETLEDLRKLRGSKYIQSNLDDTFRQAKDALDAGRWVLFSGTPCQIAGLKTFLGKKNYEKLLTVDMVCHGVPSPRVWENYIREIEGEYDQKVTQVSFRDKTEGWVRFSLAIDMANGKNYRANVTKDPYLRGFVGNLYLRKSCYRCAFKAGRYLSDITLADFWGIEKIYPNESDNKGISLIIIHTEKGDRCLELLREQAILKPIPLKDAVSSNPSYFKSVPPNPFRDRVLKQIETKGTRKTIEKYWGNSLISKIRRKILKLLG